MSGLLHWVFLESVCLPGGFLVAQCEQSPWVQGRSLLVFSDLRIVTPLWYVAWVSYATFTGSMEERIPRSIENSEQLLRVHPCFEVIQSFDSEFQKNVLDIWSAFLHFYLVTLKLMTYNFWIYLFPQSVPKNRLPMRTLAPIQIRWLFIQFYF